MLVAWYPLNGNLKDISGNHYDLNTNHIYGDIDGDGRITQEDSELASQYFNGITTLTSEQTIRADVNQDGKVNSRDSEIILNYAHERIIDGAINCPVPGQIRHNPIWGEGKTGKAWVNNSCNSFTNRVMINELKGATKFSISCWVKVNSIIDHFRDIFSFYTLNSQDNSKKALRLESHSYSGNHLAWYNNGHLCSDNSVIAHAINLGEWIHFTFVFGKEQAYKYVNGRYIGTNKYSQSQLDFDKISLTGEIRLGSSPEKDLYLDGSICNIKIYDHCLSKEEAYQDYLSPMLHYTFEQPFAEETENLSSDYYQWGASTYSSDDKGNYFIKIPANAWNGGIWLNNAIVYGGNYYTWSLEVNPDIDLSVDREGDLFDGNLNSNTYSSNGLGRSTVDYYKEKIPKNTWTRIWVTTYIEPEVGIGKLNHAFCPKIPTGVSQIKVYYRNLMLEKKDHMTPYTRNRREQQLIRDNSGMGNDGVVKYKREEIPINVSIRSNGCKVVENNKIFTINNFSYNTDSNTRSNVVANLYKMPKNSRYHYLNSIISYEFDIKLENIAIENGKTFRCFFQGGVYKSGSIKWLSGGPVHVVDITNRLRKGTNGTYHVTIEKKIINTETVDSETTDYDIQLRFDYIQSGTITISNFHTYYQNLDTSILGITDRISAIGTHSAHFNGKTRIETSVLKNREIEQITYSAWFYPLQDTVKVRYRNLFTQHETYASDLWISYDTENAGLWAYIYGDDNQYHYFTRGSTGIVKPENWNHIVYTFNKGVSKFYLNGELIATQNNSSTFTKIKCRDQVSYIGQGSEGPQDWHPLLEGYLDDMRLYPIPLTDEEVKALYHTKAKIDKDSNMYTNQLVETKNESVFELRGDLYIFSLYSNGTLSSTFKDKIFTVEIQNPETASNGLMGFYIGYQSFNDNIISGKHYRYSLYVKLPKSGSWFIGHERLRPDFYYAEYEANKWYHVVYDGIASNNNYRAFCFYHKEPSSSTNKIESGDKIQIRDFEFYRIDDDLFPIERDTDPKVTKKAQIKGFEVNEIDYDRLTKRQNIVEKDGAKWVEVFYHNTNNNTEWFADEAEALHCTSEYKYSRLDCLEQYRQSDGKFEFLLEYPIEHPGQFNRWKQTDNPTKVQESNGALIPANGYEAIHIDWSSGFGGLLKHKRIMHSNEGVFTLLDGSTNHNNFFYSVGYYNNTGKDSLEIGAWADKVPGPSLSGGIDNQVVTEIRLYARISDEQINLGPTIINKYGAQWLEVFYHNNHSGTVLFKDDEEAMHTIGNKDKYSILDCLEQYRGKDNKFEFLLEYPTENPGRYNRWKQTDNPAETIDIRTDIPYDDTSVVNGYEPIHIDWLTEGDKFGGLILSINDDSLIDGNIGNNWHFAIGVNKRYNLDGKLGIPGPIFNNNSEVYDNPNYLIQEDTHLYVRIDNINNRQQIAKLLKTGNIKTKEIKEV
ncbi:LamG-like jellyroll fold domain-containing protein [uncultured Clostridium sp.]|uniref:LamG-like jellyroll fold domain-containing protein n=1 Tax=uncultured Clostridium sp. TaxID=59620 RepID=UPI00260B5CE1|nr:LamG-like jellyroll fold domain-containing protein [uncultured Clostridium sp.]